MKEEIISNIDNPATLEKLYRDNKLSFKKTFNLIYPDIIEMPAARVWHERLNFQGDEITWGTRNELLFVIIAACIAGFVAKIPDMISLNPDYFYPRNVSFIVFPFLSAYFSWKQKPGLKRIILPALIFAVSAVFINLLPDNPKSDTLILACIHLPVFLWLTLGYVFAGEKLNDPVKRLDYLRYNGNLAVMGVIIVIACAVLTAVTFGLFRLIGINIAEVYNKYIIIWGGASVPLAATYLVQTNPNLVNKVAPVIAKVFTPLVFVTLVIYLASILYTGKDPYNDRDFLLVFNALLIGVMAIIFFSIAETSKNSDSRL